MDTQFCRVLISVCLAAVLVGCVPADNSAENAALQREIDRLENEIGRLEFRVYQLESAVLNGTDESAAPDEPADASPEAPAPEAARGRYDLTPVE